MKFQSEPVEEHPEVPLSDDGQWEQLVSHWAQRADRTYDTTRKNACYVVTVGEWPDDTARDAQLRETLALVRAQGDKVVGHEAYRLTKPDPRTLVRRGKAAEFAERARLCGADLLVIDAELTPSQARNLEDAAGIAVSDREAVILNVFLQHAKTRKSKIQVEIAHLEYLRPRICGLGLDMDQQAGGVMAGRGPGETASELMARRLDKRMAELRKAFARIERAGSTQRKRRARCPRLSLIGYTNAGKTTLMNALTSETLSARDRPFETLDTTSRALTRHGEHVLISDTVGFIRRLPQRLLESFASTLSEIEEASLLVPVIDVSDPEWPRHVEVTHELIQKLGADHLPRYYVFNKLDQVQAAPDDATIRGYAGEHPFTLLSSRDVEAVGRLKATLVGLASVDQETAQVFVPYSAASVMSEVYRRCRVLDSEAREDGLLFTLQAPARVLAELRKAAEEDRS